MFVINWVLSSAGRASPLQGEGRRFDPCSTHQLLFQWKVIRGQPRNKHREVVNAIAL